MGIRGKEKKQFVGAKQLYYMHALYKFEFILMYIFEVLIVLFIFKCKKNEFFLEVLRSITKPTRQFCNAA